MARLLRNLAQAECRLVQLRWTLGLLRNPGVGSEASLFILQRELRSRPSPWVKLRLTLSTGWGEAPTRTYVLLLGPPLGGPRRRTYLGTGPYGSCAVGGWSLRDHPLRRRRLRLLLFLRVHLERSSSESRCEIICSANYRVNNSLDLRSRWIIFIKISIERSSMWF